MKSRRRVLEPSPSLYARRIERPPDLVSADTNGTDGISLPLRGAERKVVPKELATPFREI